MAKDEKLKKSTDDEQLDNVAGGCMMPQDNEKDFFDNADRVLNGVNRKGEFENVDIADFSKALDEKEKALKENPIFRTH